MVICFHGCGCGCEYGRCGARKNCFFSSWLDLNHVEIALEFIYCQMSIRKCLRPCFFAKKKAHEFARRKSRGATKKELLLGLKSYSSVCEIGIDLY